MYILIKHAPHIRCTHTKSVYEIAAKKTHTQKYVIFILSKYLQAISFKLANAVCGGFLTVDLNHTN